ncbi:AAA family ATPase [Hansschlegelia beijingensis]|uniref:Putative ATPase n=1 Tax=Hansschlegelia beijingensis TaxID=1133344 RepID=A0A7W6CZ17_9HYPH|nr:putative ATPase [Hansschlegelia beijingensis]
MLISLRMEWARVEDPDAYPYNLPAIARLQELDLDAPIVLFVGPNGSGKSTLIEAIAAHLGCNPEGGSPNFTFDTAQTLSPLHKVTRLVRRIPSKTDRYFYRADAFHILATEIRRLELAGRYGGDLHEMSHGQAVMRLLNERFGARGLYLLDEPEAALAPETQLEVIARIVQLVQQGARFVLATHSPLLMALPNALIYELTEEGAARRSYQELGHVRLYRRFLGDPESVVSRLLSED